ncbi:YggT family protein [Jonesia denitrificans]|uniref:YggT family protein n=1 Tax=Jonesia denitrificans (strain ATCC 14870 / DSM 20603 / BCRC 15368 / CIP 55.134 / JCM 11481 / NBRC 15587 / NCTC 10816 / Prevot 55134) TaxID=471856 RepID=C7R3K0_JONDD|nr:YggT family protein [Jonesia denitrificans]ACV08736.1 protein of unknown function YGGT [Jonesia denitrificans DSM 20603]ASE09939.1 YggT family protein [Jonesia denitrificans]QXB42273.1 YggT family protein [Jonesia denitrificans]SQH20725.1 YGGT family [Jonesia denitrificans]
MSLIFSFIAMVLWVYLIALIGRAVFGWVQVFARDWRPRGFLLVVAESIYTITDPPLRALSRIIPPIRIGSIALDVGFMLLFIAVAFLMQLFWVLAATA